MTIKVPVTFMPSGMTAWVEPGTTVLDAGRSAGVAIAAPCGGRGVCGSCGVRVLAGELDVADADEQRGLSRAPAGVRLACRARVLGAVTVRPVISSARPTPAGAGEGQRVVVGIDLGTTNVACLAVEADGGREVGAAVVPNAQRSWGADVLSRISAAMSGGAQDLREAAEQSIADACRAAIGSTDVVGAVLSGNTAMTAMVAGVDPTSLGTHPFSAPELPSHLTPGGPVSTALGGAEVAVTPPMVSFVGGDAFAGLVHTGMLYAEKPALLLDLGTNAEIVLADSGRLYAASAAAGPAFEGAGIECGGPAVAGAVSAVHESNAGQLALEVIGGAPPAWLSGAGLVSLLALLLRTGHLSPEGRLLENGEYRERFVMGDDGVLRFKLTDDLSLSQLDVRTLQLAKAAVRVGVERVLATGRVRADELEHLFVAGAFGGALAPGDLVELGIVPTSALPAVRSVGNGSLMGSVALALAPELMDELRARAETVEHVDLAAAQGFADSLMAAVEFSRFDVE